MFFDFLSFTLDQQPKQLQFGKKNKNPSPSPSPSPLVPCTTKLFYWWVGWGHLLDGSAFATLGNSLHKRSLHYYKTDFEFFVCARALARTPILLELSAWKWPIAKRGVGLERWTVIYLYSIDIAPLLHHQTVEVITCGGCWVWINTHMHAHVCIYSGKDVFPCLCFCSQFVNSRQPVVQSNSKRE